MSQPLLSGQQEYIEESEAVDPFAERVDELEDRIVALESKMGQVKREAVLAVLQMFSDSLRHIASGQMGIPDAVTVAPTSPQFDQKWEAWKQKLGSGTAPARIIDALLKQGPLNRTQLRSFGELGWSTLDAATSRLRNLGLIEKSGDRWNLKG